eukprot:GAHX01003716.1.p1 GENE.GAHX01003716.1~~GAHX01003716.1.p1  ORF type:complete len:80 (-),score=4.77 GAHX01003716.1:314-553(-)
MAFTLTSKSSGNIMMIYLVIDVLIHIYSFIISINNMKICPPQTNTLISNYQIVESNVVILASYSVFNTSKGYAYNSCVL